MKKIGVLLFIAITLSAQVFGQAYSDIRKIDSLMKKPSDSTIRQLADIVLPYFKKGAVIDEKNLKELLPADISARLMQYLSEKTKDLTSIKRLENNPAAQELKPSFNIIASALIQLNNLLNTPNATLIEHLKPIGGKFDFINVPLRYDNVSLVTDLDRLILLEAVPSDSIAKMNTEVKASYEKEKADLRTKTKIGVAEASGVKSTLDSANSLLQVIADAKTSIFNLIDKNGALKGLLVTTVNNKPVTSDYFSLKYFPVQNFVTQPNGAQAATLSAFKMPTQAEMIESLVIFISKRVGQEVAMSFIEALKKRAKTVALVSELFPNTMKLLQEGNAYEVPKLGSVWHYAIALDLNELPFHLAESDFVNNKLENSPYKDLLKDVVTVGKLARDGNSLPEIGMLLKGGIYQLKDPTMVTGFEVLNLINQELSSSAGYSRSKGFWINWTELNNFSNRDWDLFLKFIALKYGDRIFNAKIFDIDLKDLNAETFNNPKWQTFRTTIQKALILLNQFQDRRLASLQSSNTSLNAQVKPMSFWECQQALFDIVLNNELINKNIKIAEPVKLINSGIQVYRLQEQGNYAAMFRESLKLIEKLAPQQYSKLNELFLRSWRAGKEKHEAKVKAISVKLDSLNELYQQLRIDPKLKTVADIDQLKKFAQLHSIKLDNATTIESIAQEISVGYMQSLKKNNGELILAVRSPEGIRRILVTATKKVNANFAIDSIKPKNNLAVVLKTAEFFTDVMGAGNSEQLAQVIEAYAMPPGSYKVKRHSRYSVDLDAYVGLYGGAEQLNHSRDQNAGDLAPVWGLSAPIGLSFTWGGRHVTREKESASFLNKRGMPKTLNGNSFTLGLSVIDIAAPLAFRLSGDSQEALPETLTWSQIFSPGVHARWGIRNTPLCISTGLQYTPELRKIEQTSKSQQAFRGYVGLFFDLPLFNIYRR